MMNDNLQNYARSELKKGLAQLPESHHILFKRMYAFPPNYPEGMTPQEAHKTRADLDMDINDVVDVMPERKLDWAMQQVQRSIDKLSV